MKHGNCGGSLVQFQPGDLDYNALPFQIGKVLVAYDIQPDDVRGNHAHHQTEEIVVVLTGGCVFELDDGKGRSARLRLSATPAGDLVEEYPTSDLRPPTSDLCPPTSDLRPPTSDLCPPTSDLRPPTSDLCPPPSDLRLPTSVLRPPASAKMLRRGKPTSDLRPPSSEKLALLLYPHIWRVYRDFEPDTRLLIVANRSYDEKDYIRDRAEFERFAMTWSDTGGSGVKR